MPIGDSITSGEMGWSTYRCYLDGMLNGAGVSFDFVGSKSQPTNGPYACPTSFDEDHESYWGQYVVGVAHSATASVEELQPDVALIHLGTNDITGLRGPASTASKLESFITDLQAVKPDLTILVAQLIPCDAMGFDPLYEPQCAEDLPAFNDHLASFTSLSTDQSSVIVVDMETGFGLDLLRDGVHPTDAGFELMAARWMTALQEAGVIGDGSTSALPEPPSTEATTVTVADAVEPVSVYLTFEGGNCTYEGPAKLEPGPIELLFLNESEDYAGVNLVSIDEGYTIKDVIDDLGPQPSSGHHPPWTRELGTWRATGTSETHLWEGSLEVGLYAMVCVRIDPLGVWFGTGLTVEGLK